MNNILHIIKYVGSNTEYTINKIKGEYRATVLLTWAQTLDGVVGDQGPITISSDAGMEMTHGLRGLCDGIIVGINTVIADNCKLTCRSQLTNGQDPQVFVMDSNGRLPLKSYIAMYRSPIVVFKNETDEIITLKENGIRCWQCLTVQSFLDKLFINKIYSVMVEGGPSVLNAFEPHADIVVVTIGKRLYGKSTATRIGITMDLRDAEVFNWEEEFILLKNCAND